MHSHLLSPLLFLLSALGLFVGSGLWIVFILTAARNGKAQVAALISLILLPAMFYAAIWIQTLALRLALVAILWLIVDAAIFKWVLTPIWTWNTLKFARGAGRQTFLHMILITGSILFMIPFAWLVVTSLKEESEMSKFPPVWLPTQQVERAIGGSKVKIALTRYCDISATVGVLREYDDGRRLVQVIEPTNYAGQTFTTNRSALKALRRFAPVWKNYADALKFLPPETGHGLVFLLNTLQISILSILGTLLSSSMVAYGFARLRWPGRDTLFVILLATMMLPGAVTMMPVFLIFRWLGWIDTLKPLWVPAFFGSAFNIFLLRQFFLGIPTELEDAAMLDGCSYYMIYWRIMLPQIKPALAAITIMAFMAAWNDFRGPLIYISSPEKQPLAYALQLFQSAHGGEPGMLMAASTLVILPVLGLFFFTQRYFIQGITLTGIKG